MEDTITIKKESLWKYSTFILLAIVIVGAFVFFTENNTTGKVVNNVVNTQNNNPSGINSPVEITLDSDTPTIGDKNAPVTVVEFSDFSCPFCAAASGDNEQLNAYMKQRDSSWEPIATNLIKDYVNSGKVKFAVKFSFGHSGGHPAQLVAWCLNDQSSDLYWKFYPKAFADYDLNNQGTQAVEDISKMKDIAKSIGADMTKLESCLNSNKYSSRFDSEQAQGQASGVQGTPAFFVNGQLVEGAVPYSQIKALIDSELAK